MKEKFKSFFKNAYKDKRFIAAVTVFGLIASFCLGHSLSFGDNRGQIGQLRRNGRFAQGQMQNVPWQGQQGPSRRGQIQQNPNQQVQGGQIQIPNQSGVDGTSGATTKQN